MINPQMTACLKLIEFMSENSVEVYNYDESSITCNMKDINMKIDDSRWENQVISFFKNTNICVTEFLYGKDNWVTIRFGEK